jgi:hypothetical protein
MVGAGAGAGRGSVNASMVDGQSKKIHFSLFPQKGEHIKKEFPWCIKSFLEPNMMDDSLISEFKRLLVYLYKTDSPVLKRYLEPDQNYTIELVGDLILDLALEEVDKGEDCHTYRRWIYT